MLIVTADNVRQAWHAVQAATDAARDAHQLAAGTAIENLVISDDAGDQGDEGRRP